MAQGYRRFGSRVTIIEPGPQIMGREDADVAEETGRLLTGEGIDVLLQAQPLRVDGLSGHAVSVTVRTNSADGKVDGSHLLVATGRVANTADIGLDQAGIALTPRGFIQGQ